MAFYPNGAPAPANMPKYLVIVPSGAYGYDNPDAALEAARQLKANGIDARCFIKGGA